MKSIDWLPRVSHSATAARAAKAFGTPSLVIH